MISAAIITFDATDFDWDKSVQPWIDFCFENNDTDSHVSLPFPDKY